ncbi:MAG TPA: Crp/Fnr family transcriptional regulator [Gammaproteobacteria bacterium]|nr:Crp/Fnr family transcriptional regulator [Gammaproteobacteria bacterium]
MAGQTSGKGAGGHREAGSSRRDGASGALRCGLVPECGILCNRDGPGAPGVSRRRLARGAVLVTAGTPAVRVFGIRRGLVRLWRAGGPPAGERTVALLGAGDMLGLGALDDPVWQYHATVVLATELCVVPLAAFLERADADLAFCRHVSGLLARRMRSLRAEGASDRATGLDARLSSLLQRLAAEDPTPAAVDAGRPRSMLPPSELARLLNESENAVRNALERLEKGDFS